jgi:hypothetical protein
MYHIGLIDQNMQKHVCRGNISSSCEAKLPKTLRTGTQWVVQPQSTRTSSSTNFLLTGLHWAASTGKPLDLQYSCTGSDEKIQDIPGDLSLQSRIPPKMYVNSLAWVAIVPLLQDRAPTFALVLWKPAIVITTVFYGTGQMVARSWCSNSKLAMETFCSRSDTSILCLVFPNRFFTFRHIQHVQNIIHIHSHIHLYSDDKPYEYIWLYIYIVIWFIIISPVDPPGSMATIGGMAWPSPDCPPAWLQWDEYPLERWSMCMGWPQHSPIGRP